MLTLLILAAALAFWCLAPLPVAVVVGRAFRAGEDEATYDEVASDYDAAGV